MRTRCVAAWFFAAPATAQTWAGGATDPTLAEVIAVDRTGELPPDYPVEWPYDFEDLAGDGETFRPQERTVDIRTAYGAIDATTLWLRVYVSDLTGPSANIDVYFFLDTDASEATGGPADPAEIDPELVPYETGGFEFVVHAKGNSTIDLWDWNAAAGLYVERDPATYVAEASTGLGVDPIAINYDEHGFVQATIALEAIGVAADGSLVAFVRTWNPSGKPGTGFGDTEVGEPGPIPPGDGDGDGVPDPADPADCNDSSQCPGGLACIDGECVPCATDADCPCWSSCEAGACVPWPCANDAECAGGAGACGDGACAEGRCVPPGGGESESEAEGESEGEAESEGECATDEDCPAGLVCVDGACVEYDLVGAVQGGACTCSAGAHPPAAPLALLLAVVGLLLVRRRRP